MLFVEKLLAIPGALSASIKEAVNNEVERRRLPQVHYSPGVVVRGAENITVGKNCFFDHKAFLSCNIKDGFIRLGDNVEIGPYSILWGGGGIIIGSNVHIGTHVHITSMEGSQVAPEQIDVFEPLEIARAPITIGDHVLIYSHAVIVPGVTIGHHAAIGAGAVVVEDVPPYALVGGVPARVIRYTNTPRTESSSVPA